MRLAIELARKAKFDQFLAHGVGADRMSHRCQRFSEFCPCFLETHIRGRTGSPRVAGSTSRSSSGMRPGSTSATARRPPPARRTLSSAGGFASRSSSLRLIVERARPVIRDAMARPPHPAVRTSATANNRRPRSSSLRPTVSQRHRMAPSSIVQPAYARAPKSGIPLSRVILTHRNKVRFSILPSVLRLHPELSALTDCVIGLIM